MTMNNDGMELIKNVPTIIPLIIIILIVFIFGILSFMYWYKTKIGGEI